MFKKLWPLMAASLIFGTAAVPATASFRGRPGQIAFSRMGERPGIRIMERDGSGMERLTRGTDIGAQWSPDGSQIVFERWLTDGFTEIAVISQDGSGRHVVSTPSLGMQQGCALQPPSWSYDGAWIQYADDCFDQAPRVAQLRVAASDGSLHFALTDYGSFNHTAAQPWSPDSTELVFSSMKEGTSDLYIGDYDGSAVSPLTDDQTDELEPVWSPLGDRIAFVTQTIIDEKPKGYIESVTPAGEERRVLYEGKYAVGQPLWSPDGSMIAFNRYTLYGTPTAVIIDADGAVLTVIGKGYSVTGAAWSPSSGSILLEHSGDIANYRLKTGTIRSLTDTKAFETGIDWQADQ